MGSSVILPFVHPKILGRSLWVEEHCFPKKKNRTNNGKIELYSDGDKETVSEIGKSPKI